MGRIVLATEAVEQSTFVVAVSFLDEDGAAVVPDSAAWSLLNAYGIVVNSRSDVAISPLAATATIVLTGLDLQMLDGQDDGRRLLLVEATYSSTLGSGLNLREEIEFEVRPLAGVHS